MGRTKSGKILACQTCGKKFYVRPSRIKSKYCSRHCRKPWNTGLSIDDPRVKEGVIKASRANIGRKNPNAYFSICKGKIFGKNHWNWKGGIHKINYSERCYFNSLGKYRNLRKKVLKRDNYICQNCGKRGGKLHIDHIKPWSLFPKLRFNLNNLRTLCSDCHRKSDTWGTRSKNKYALRSF